MLEGLQKNGLLWVLELTLQLEADALPSSKLPSGALASLAGC